jgi:hypothetical protein
MSAILPAAPTELEDDDTSQIKEFNSWPMFPLEKTRGGYTKVDSLRFAAEAGTLLL